LPPDGVGGDALALLEMALVFGGVLGLAVWQLVSLRRERRRDREQERERR